MNYRRFSFLFITSLPLAVLLVLVSLLSDLEVRRAFSAPGPSQNQELGIVFNKTVSLDPGVCGTSEMIDIPANTEVTYCFEVINSGTITLTQHELVDSELDLLLDEASTLEPGGSMSFTSTVLISATTVNSATWTAFNPGPTDTISATDSATVTVVAAALIIISPQTLSTTQELNEQITLPLDISNEGDMALQWLLYQETPRTSVQYATESRSNPTNLTPSTSGQFVDSATSCRLYENYAGAEPPGYAEYCMDQSQVRKDAATPSVRGPTDIAYAHDVGFVSDNFVWHHLNDFSGQSVVGNQPARIFGYDFDVTGQILYGLNFDTLQLGTVDLNSGAFSAIGSSIPMSTSEDLTGLTIHPITGEAYAATTDGIQGRIYDIDLTTGAMTFIGGDPKVPFLIDIAINPEGVMYGHDISTDSIYTIDIDTGLANLVGLTGEDANFAQGMDFDNYDGTLYAWIYEGGGLNQYGIIDLVTGGFFMLAIDNPTGEFVGATRTPLVDSCDPDDDVPWLNANPTTGSIDPGMSQTISVTVDSTNLAAGIHHGVICIESNDFYQTIVRIPVTLEVEPYPLIRLNKTVGLEPDECATTDNISVARGAMVYYCYEITNTGYVPLSTHDLVDSQFGDPIFSELSESLLPGNSMRRIVDTVITESIVNTATWTAYNPGPTDIVSDTAIATVTVVPAALITVNPNSLSSFLGPVEQISLPLYINNEGDIELQWLLYEEETQVTNTYLSPSLSNQPNTNLFVSTEIERSTLTPQVDSCESEDDVLWLSASPITGIVGPGLSQTISITVDSTNLVAGVHHGVVCIESNDFYQTVVRIPVTLEVESFASIVLKKTVGLTANECATTSTLSVWPGTRVYYCYDVTNTGSVPFSRQSLVDSQFENPIFHDLSAPLLPGESLRPMVDAVIYRTIVGTATWTAFNPGPTDQVTATDTARVVVPAFSIFVPYISKT